MINVNVTADAQQKQWLPCLQLAIPDNKLHVSYALSESKKPPKKSQINHISTIYKLFIILCDGLFPAVVTLILVRQINHAIDCCYGFLSVRDHDSGNVQLPDRSTDGVFCHAIQMAGCLIQK